MIRVEGFNTQEPARAGEPWGGQKGIKPRIQYLLRTTYPAEPAVRACGGVVDFEDVVTYIQSGNVIFRTLEKSKTEINKKIENALFEKTGNNIINHLVTFSEMKKIISGKPKDFGEDSENYKYDVIFLIAPLKAKDAIKEIRIKDGVDKAWEGEKVIYASRLIKEFNKSHLSKIAESPIYTSVTIRNWNTTRKLFELLESFLKTEAAG